MTVEQCWKYYREITTKASEVVRQLAFAGIALIWALKPEKSQVIDREFLLPAGLIALGLSLDLLQYLVQARSWKSLAKAREFVCKKQIQCVLDERRQHEEWNDCIKQEFEPPPNFHRRELVCFWGKIATIAAAYVTLLGVVTSRFIFK